MSRCDVLGEALLPQDALQFGGGPGPKTGIVNRENAYGEFVAGRYHEIARYHDVATDTPLIDFLDESSSQVFADIARPALAHQSVWQGDLVFRAPSDDDAAISLAERKLPVSTMLVAHRNVAAACFTPASSASMSELSL